MNSILHCQQCRGFADGPSTSFSTENNTWYKWKTPADWIRGQAAFIRVFEPVCNSQKACKFFCGIRMVIVRIIQLNLRLLIGHREDPDEYYHQWSPIAGRTYYISVDGYAGTACQFRLELRSQSVMPVNLITLDAKSKGNAVQLSWVTSEEGIITFSPLRKAGTARILFR